eukprot:2838582-Prymnesium_polylepis.1
MADSLRRLPTLAALAYGLLAYGVVIPVLLCGTLLKTAAFAGRAAADCLCGRRAGVGARRAAEREPLSPHDAAWLHETPTQPMVVNAVLVFQAPCLDLATVRDL